MLLVQTRQEHMDALRYIYGYKTFSGQNARNLKKWLEQQAEEARLNEDMAQRFVRECRPTQTILPCISTIERFCADALIAAKKLIETKIVNRLDDNMRSRLDDLLTDMIDDRLTRFIWLRQFEVGNNSAGATPFYFGGMCFGVGSSHC
jgi:Transposase.